MAVSREQLIFDVMANTDRAGRNVVDLGRKMGAASDDAMALAKRLDELSAKSASARVKVEGDKEATVALDKLDLKMASVGNKVMRPDITVEGAARAAVELAALDLELDKLGAKGGSAEAATTATTALAGTNVSGMGALVAAGTVLSPMLVTLGIGLGGVAAAAYGVAKPIEAAAQKAGGLRANLALLNPEQRQVATGILALGTQFGAFEKQLQPEVFGVFNKGLSLASHLLHDVEPVAAATGRGLGNVLGQIDKEFQSGTWQQFFGFMAKTAGPDLQQLGGLFTGLLGDLPPLVEGLQPLASGLVGVATDATKVIGVTSQLHISLPLLGATIGAFAGGPIGALIGGLTGVSLELAKVHTSVDATIPSWTKSGDATAAAIASLNAYGPQVAKYIEWLHRTDQAGNNTIAVQKQFAAASKTAGSHAATAASGIQAEAAAVTALNTAESKALGNLVTYSNSILTTSNDAVGLRKALAGSSDEIGTHTAAQRASFQAANTFITDLSNQAQAAIASGKGVGAASRAISGNLPLLDSAKSKSRLYWQELQTLVSWLHKLQAMKNIREVVVVTGSGSWTMHNPSNQSLPGGFPGGVGAASGMFVTGGTPGRDSVLINAMPGELVVPTPIVASGAVDHLRGSIPGFSAGGFVPSYSGTVPGLQPWITGNTNAQIKVFGQTVASSLLAAMKAATAAAQSSPGFGIAPSGPLQSYARSLLAAYGWSNQWAAFNDIVMRESGWNVHATNPSSGAYGIPQALPPGKMASAGADWAANGFTQLRWMMGYLKSRWGSPSNADANEISQHWYDNGGWLHPGATLAVNNTGRPERVLPPGRSHEGPLVHIENQYNATPTDATVLAQKLSFAITAAGLGS